MHVFVCMHVWLCASVCVRACTCVCAFACVCDTEKLQSQSYFIAIFYATFASIRFILV